jgi:hypothetical protein
MEITSLHKYISLVKLPNDSVEVLFAGQPCLYTENVLSLSLLDTGSTHSICWRINPAFAKLVYGAKTVADIPRCTDKYDTPEEAIAAGLVKLHELGAFNTEVDLPPDSYADTMNQIMSDVQADATKKTDNVMEAHTLYRKMMVEMLGKDYFRIVESTIKPKKKYSVHFTTESGEQKRRVCEAYSVKAVIDSWSTGTVIDVRLNGTSVLSEATDDEIDAAHEKWKDDVQKAHPEKKFKFKGTIEPTHGSNPDGTTKVADRISAIDRDTGKIHGVWDNETNTGKVLGEEVVSEKELTPEEKKKQEEIVQALKKDKKFKSKYGDDAESVMYAIATKTAKEVA